MRRRRFGDRIVRPSLTARLERFARRNQRLRLRLCQRRRLGDEERVLDPHAAWHMNPPRSYQIVRVGESNVVSFVIGKVQVVASERIVDPVGDPYQCRALDIDADTGIEARMDNRPVEQPLDSDILLRIHSSSEQQSHENGDSAQHR